MTSGNFSKILTILLVIAIIGIIGLFVFIGIDIYNKYYLQKETSEAVAKFDEQVPDIQNSIVNEIITENPVNTTTNTNQNTITNSTEDPFAGFEKTNTTTDTTEQTPKQVLYKGFVQEGTISIPAISSSNPVLEVMTIPALEVGVAIQAGPGLNKVGNTVIAGHNYRNGTLFSDNKNIQLGDKIFIKDTTGLTVTYVVYEKYQTTPEDASYINRDTEGKREITLYSCNDDSSMRIIVKAREQ